jgi:7-cyano-7-deazaguanine reductase
VRFRLQVSEFINADRICAPTGYAGAVIETIENRYAGRPYRVDLTFPEFTSICPLTGAPDFGTITIRYVPAERLLEQKALRDFLTGFRDRDVFQEEAVNAILDAVVASCDPVYCQVEGAFNMRGGMSVRAIAEHGSDPRESRASSASAVCLRGKRHARIKEERTRALSIPQLSLFEPTARRRS